MRLVRLECGGCFCVVFFGVGVCGGVVLVVWLVLLFVVCCCWGVVGFCLLWCAGV